MRGGHKIVLFSFLTLLSGCTTTQQVTPAPNNTAHIVSYGNHIALPTIETGKRPEWLIRKSQNYPTRDYYTVTSQAATPEQAATKAHELAYELLNPVASENAAPPQIKIAAIWHKENTAHALAIISRPAAEDYLRSRLNRLDEASQADVNSLSNNEDPLIKIGLLQTLIERQQLRAKTQKSLKKVELAHRGRESPWDTRRWSLQMAELLQQLRITPIMDVSLSNPRPLTHMLEQGLENAGLQPHRSLEADYILRGTLDIEDKELDNGYVQASGKLQLQLQHKDKPISYGMQSWDLEATSLSAETAKKRLLHKAERLLTSNKRETIIDIAAQAGR